MVYDTVYSVPGLWYLSLSAMLEILNGTSMMYIYLYILNMTRVCENCFPKGFIYWVEYIFHKYHKKSGWDHNMCTFLYRLC